ncbi:MAG TPA: PadR family transcriptional regulator [Gemmatimonadaceae bacterium]|jgi:transcriptional regulator|nr:PadR family transcriptional regulator [Gemmatimonadaceae bacterium]
MSPSPDHKIELLQGTLDMLILKTLLFGAAHGHGIATHIRQTTRDILTVEHGSLYPALHRLQRDGYITARWETPRDRNRQFKYYRLTAAGRRRLTQQHGKWEEIVKAVTRVMRPEPATEG